MELAARIRDLRVQAGLTKTALARPRYTVSYVSQIESGRRTPSTEAQAEEYGLSSLSHQGKLVSAEALAQQGRFPEAIDAYEEVLELDLPERDRALAVAGLAKVYRTVGDLAYAAQIVESFLDRSNRGPLDPSLTAELQSVLVSIYFERGDVTRAERAARRALAAASHGGSLELRAKAYWYASRVL